jgi:predicted nucleotidyltransferase
VLLLATYSLPDPSMAIPFGEENRAFVPVPSMLPAPPSRPASSVRVPCTTVGAGVASGAGEGAGVGVGVGSGAGEGAGVTVTVAPDGVPVSGDGACAGADGKVASRSPPPPHPGRVSASRNANGNRQRIIENNLRGGTITEGGGVTQRPQEGGSRCETWVMVRVAGDRKHYEPNPASPIYEELSGRRARPSAAQRRLRVALAPLKDRIQAALVFGFVAKQTDRAASDIDLMIISDTVEFPDVVLALQPIEQGLGREINPVIYTQQELARRVKADERFVAETNPLKRQDRFHLQR